MIGVIGIRTFIAIVVGIAAFFGAKFLVSEAMRPAPPTAAELRAEFAKQDVAIWSVLETHFPAEYDRFLDEMSTEIGEGASPNAALSAAARFSSALRVSLAPTIRQAPPDAIRRLMTQNIALHEVISAEMGAGVCDRFAMEGGAFLLTASVPAPVQREIDSASSLLFETFAAARDATYVRDIASDADFAKVIDDVIAGGVDQIMIDRLILGEAKGACEALIVYLRALILLDDPVADRVLTEIAALTAGEPL